MFAGEASRVKSAICTVRASVAVIVPDVKVFVLEVAVEVVFSVPVTIKLSDDEDKPFRLPTVSVLDCPGKIVAGSKAQVAGAMLVQPRTMEPVDPPLDEAKTVN